jgi:hypothetical protein
MANVIVDPGPSLEQAQKCGRVNLGNGIPTISLLIVGSPMTIQIHLLKKKQKKTAQIRFHLKRHTVHKCTINKND